MTTLGTTRVDWGLGVPGGRQGTAARQWGKSEGRGVGEGVRGRGRVRMGGSASGGGGGGGGEGRKHEKKPRSQASMTTLGTTRVDWGLGVTGQHDNTGYNTG